MRKAPLDFFNQYENECRHFTPDIFPSNETMGNRKLTSLHDLNEMDFDYTLKEYSALLGKQVQANHHFKFMENCKSEKVVPKGILGAFVHSMNSATQVPFKNNKEFINDMFQVSYEAAEKTVQILSKH